MYATLEDAIVLAVEAHKGQVDKAGEPYILHPLRVMFRFPPYKRLQRIVAILHDALEDTYLTAEVLHHRNFEPEAVAAIVAMTHVTGEPRAEYTLRCAKNPISNEVKHEDIGDNTTMERLLRLDNATQDRLMTKYKEDLRILDEHV